MSVTGKYGKKYIEYILEFLPMLMDMDNKYSDYDIFEKYGEMMYKIYIKFKKYNEDDLKTSGNIP